VVLLQTGEFHIGIVVERREGRNHLRRSSRRWEDKIKMNLKEVGWRDMGSSNLAQTSGSCECSTEPFPFLKMRVIPCVTEDFLRKCSALAGLTQVY